jgi:hypothetical protein
MPPQSTDAPEVERAIVGRVLTRATKPAELYTRIHGGATPTDIDAAVDRLAAAGVIRRARDGSLRTTAALRHLDALGLIGV